MKRTGILAIFLALAVGLPGWTDTLEMKDGRVITGTFISGTRTSIRFRTADKTLAYPMKDVVAVSFGTTPAAPAAVAPSSTSSSSSTSTSSSSPAAAIREPMSSTSASATSTTAARSRHLTIPIGTRITVRTIDTINSDTHAVGETFRASLAEDLIVEGMTVARRGADVTGRLARAKQAEGIAGRAALTLELTEISINGRMHRLSSAAYEMQGGSRATDSAKTIGGAAAIGAAIGAIAGGGKGAAIGAGIGAGAGTAVQVLTKGDQVRVPSETVLEFRLEEPVIIEDFRR